MEGDAPSWLAAIGTVGALGAALLQIRNERKRRLVAEERHRAAEHIEQARLIAAYQGEEEEESGDNPSERNGRTAFYLANNSPEPVYSVVAGLVFIQGAGPHTMEDMLKLNTQSFHRLGPVAVVNILPGGLYRAWVQGTEWHRILSGRAGLEIAFSDRAGTHWIRRATGRLEELQESPLDYFQAWGLAAPHDFQTAERVAVKD